jgi:hypothetical protein
MDGTQIEQFNQNHSHQFWAKRAWPQKAQETQSNTLMRFMCFLWQSIRPEGFGFSWFGVGLGMKFSGRIGIQARH